MSSTIKQAIQALKSRIADAYTAVSAKGGTLPATQDSANLPTAIASIPSGGGGNPKEEKDINFIDHTGTIVESYTFAEAANLSALPTAIEYDGLTFLEWQFTLQEVLFYVGKKCQLNVGAYYKATDGYLHIFIHIPSANYEFSLSPYAVEWNGEEYIDWGDGNTTTAGRAAVSNTYANAGDYEIVISSNLSRGEGKYGVTISVASSATTVRKIYLSSVVTGLNLGSGCYNLYAVSNTGNTPIASPSNYTTMKALIVPTTGNVSSRMHRYICAHHAYSANYGDSFCSNLTIVPPFGEGQTVLSQEYYRRVWNVKTIYVPSSVTSIGNTVFESCYTMQDVYFYCSSVPTLPNTTTISNMNSVNIVNIHIVSSLQSSYESDTNWAAIMAMTTKFNFIADL